MGEDATQGLFILEPLFTEATHRYGVADDEGLPVFQAALGRRLDRLRRQWFAKRKSIAALLKEVMTNEASALVDTDAGNKAADADMALQDLGADGVGYALVTATLTVWDADPALADAKLRQAEKVVQGRDFSGLMTRELRWRRPACSIAGCPGCPDRASASIGPPAVVRRPV